MQSKLDSPVARREHSDELPFFPSQLTIAPSGAGTPVACRTNSAACGFAFNGNASMSVVIETVFTNRTVTPR